MMTVAAFVTAMLLAQPPSAPPSSPTAASERPTPQPPPGTPPSPPGHAAPAGAPDLAALQLQVMLDRADFSPGVIDGRMGTNTERALALYQEHRGEAPPAEMLSLASYTITDADLAGSFTPDIPSDLAEQASLPALGYRSVLESLAERFHATPELLHALNPGATFSAGETIHVPNVEPFAPPAETLHVDMRGEIIDPAAEPPTGTSGRLAARPDGAEDTHPIMSRPDVVVTVSQSASRLLVTDGAGRLVFSAPVTTGSEHDPLPIGQWTVTGLQLNPAFHYNPALFWDAKPADAKARIAPGPNNPVGVAWIDLDKEHYGLHGTPEPAAIGRAQSHGCVRLTNWDAAKLAALVKPGTKVHFVK